MFSIDKMSSLQLSMNLPQVFKSMIFRHSESFRKILCRVILVYYCYSEQSICNLTKRRTLQLIFSGEIFENGWLRTAAFEQSDITACDVTQFLTIKISFGILSQRTFNINTEFLKIATLEPILSIE